MLSEMEVKMRELKIDAFIIYTACGQPDRSFRYFAGDIPHNGAFFIKVMGRDPTVVLESDFEKATFLKKSTIKDVRILSELGMDEKIGIYGGYKVSLVRCLDDVLKDLNISKQAIIKWYGLSPLSIVDGLRETGYRISPVSDREKNLVDELILKRR